MKSLMLLTLLFFGFTNFTHLTRNKTEDIPCGAKETGVNVRILNAGEVDFTKFYLVVSGVKYEFNGLKKGETSCYKNLPYILTINSFDIEFKEEPVDGVSSKNTDGTTYEHRSDPDITNPKIEKGYFTINVTTKGTFAFPEEIVIKLKEDK